MHKCKFLITFQSAVQRGRSGEGLNSTPSPISSVPKVMVVPCATKQGSINTNLALLVIF